MAKREQLGEEGQNDHSGFGNFNSSSSNNNNNNGKRPRGDGSSAVGMLLAAAAQPPPQHPRRPFMAFSGTRHTRVGADYQVTQLPSPSMSTATMRSVHKDETAMQP